MNLWLLLAVNSITLGGLLFLLAAGFSLIFGLMRIPNLAHGSFFMLGAYFAVTLIRLGMGFWPAALLAGLGVALFGGIVERLILRRLAGAELAQVLVTLGLSFMVADVCLMVWTGDPIQIDTPALLRGATNVAGLAFPTYRLAVSIVAVIVAAALWILIERTRLGAMIRAGVDDPAMARVTGIRVSRLFTIVFCLGAWLAGFAGVIGGPILSVYPGLDQEMLPLALVVVILGGSGSLLGCLAGSLIVGFLYNFGQACFPSSPYVVLFLPVLLSSWWPTGLFGRQTVEAPASPSPWRSGDGALWVGSTYYVNVASQILFYAIFALAVNVLAGYAGIVSLGHAGLFGIAAYAAAKLLTGGYGHASVGAGALGVTLVAAAAFAVLALRARRLASLGPSTGRRSPPCWASPRPSSSPPCQPARASGTRDQPRRMNALAPRLDDPVRRVPALGLLERRGRAALRLLQPVREPAGGGAHRLGRGAPDGHLGRERDAAGPGRRRRAGRGHEERRERVHRALELRPRRHLRRDRGLHARGWCRTARPLVRSRVRPPAGCPGPTQKPWRPRRARPRQVRGPAGASGEPRGGARHGGSSSVLVAPARRRSST
jgi:branched-chain amino acid transport system permease protein